MDDKLQFVVVGQSTLWSWFRPASHNQQDKLKFVLPEIVV
jgi:hypothetical protein